MSSSGRLWIMEMYILVLRLETSRYAYKFAWRQFLEFYFCLFCTALTSESVNTGRCLQDAVMQSEECVDWPVWSRSNPYGVISALWGRLLCPPSYEDIICPRPAAINHCSLFINIQSMAPLTHTNTLPVCKQTSKQMQTRNHWLTPNTNTSNSHDHFSLSPSTPPFFFWLRFLSFWIHPFLPFRPHWLICQSRELS